MSIVVCRACGQSKRNRARGLCNPCWKNADIRDEYPSLSPFGNRGSGLFNYHPPPTVPTSALPGTEAKILVMQQRASMRQPLFDDRDAVPSL